MSASSVQQTMEKTDTVTELKATKPPIKPKPIVPPRPKQAFVPTSNSEIKSPLLSPSSGAPWSPTSDIPSAFKISQLTGPQPYGTRRTSLKRWSSSVGEDASPDGNAVLSPVDNSFAEVSAKVTPHLSSVPVKPFQTGSVWKGKSPFMLTTRGWGEHKASQGKDTVESQSAFQKQGFGLSTKDTESKDREGVPLELNAVNKSTNSSTIKLTTDGDHVNVQNSNLSLAKDKVETNSYVIGNSKKLLSQSDKIQKSQEGSPSSVSPQSDLYFGTAKQTTQYELDQDIKKEVTAYNSNLEVTQKPSIPPEGKDIKKVSGTSSPEKVNEKNESPQATIPSDQHIQTGVISEENSQNLHGGLKQVENVSLRTKKPTIISPVLTSTEKASYFDTENSEKAQAKTKESPSFVPPEPNIQEFQRYHKHGSDIKPELVPLTREEGAVSEYLQTSQSQVSEPNQSTSRGVLEKPSRVEDTVSSLITHLTDNKVTGLHEEIHHEDKENIDPVENVSVYSAHHKPAGDKAYGTESTSSINEPYSSDHEAETRPATGIQSPGYTVKTDHSSEGHQDPGTQIHDYYAEEEEYEPHENRQQEYEASARREKYRSHHENNAQSSYDSETPAPSELPGPADNQTSPHLHMRSEMLYSDKLVPREVYTYSEDESKEPTHSYIEKETPRVTQIQPEILSQQEDYKSSRPELNYNESQFMHSKSASQDPAKRVSLPEDLGDNWNQTSELQYYSAESPKLKDHELSLDKLKFKAEETAEPQYTHSHSEPQEHSYVYKEEIGEKHEPVHHKYGQSEELVYSDLLLQESAHKKEQTGLQSHMYDLFHEPVHTNKKSDEAIYEYEKQKQSSKNVQSEKIDHKYQQLEETGQKYQPPKHETLEEAIYGHGQSKETVHRDDQADKPIYNYKDFNEPVHDYVQSEESVQRYQQPEVSDHKHEQSDQQDPRSEELSKPVHQYDVYQNYGQSEEPDHKYEHSEEPYNSNVYSKGTVYTYEQSEEPDQKYKQSQESYNRNIQSAYTYEESDESDHKYDQSERPYHKYEHSEEPYNKNVHSVYSYEESDESDHKYEQPVVPGHRYKQSEESDHKYEQSEDPYNRNIHSVYTYGQAEESHHIHGQPEESDHIHGQPEESDHKYKQSEERGHKYGQAEEPDYKYGQSEESDHKYKQPEERGHKYGQVEEPDHKYGQSEESDHKYEQSEEPDHKYEQSEKSGHKYGQPEEPDHKYEQSEDPYNRNIHSVYTYGQSEESDHKYEQSEEPGDKYEQSEEPGHKYEQSGESYNRNIHSVSTYEQSEEPGHKYEQPGEPGHKYEQSEETGHKYGQAEESHHKFEQPEKTDDRYKQSEEFISRYQQEDEPVHRKNDKEDPGQRYAPSDNLTHSPEQVQLHKPPAEPAYIHIQSENRDSKHAQPAHADLELPADQYKHYQSEKADITPHISQKPSDISAQSFEPVNDPEQHYEKHQRDSYTEEPKHGDTSPHYINYKAKKLEEQDEKFPQSEGPLRESALKEATQLITDTKESHHVDGVSEETRRKLQDEKLETDGSMPQETQNEEVKHAHDKIINGHAEQDLPTVDSRAEKQAEEPEEKQTEETPAENFDFLEGTTVLDTGFMRSRASLGKKRGHRTPATGPGACNEEDDPEYWMFRDSTEPKTNQQQETEQKERVETSPDTTPDTTPSPGKAPKKGLFGGIISPSLLKGRLKTRSKTTEDEPMKRSPDSEEPKSPKEKPESPSHSLNWLSALKKKKKKQPK
ncbi:182 kDa tankyrase-1-binding protein isoform X2 [Hyperolius riggenbachi]|uniref:182 kDa tankyrase-1-binding protein isoform X2 n=1 Tax=Hyperolius riggenbachi TaxID=752182 RepID=UPI0035A3BA28